MTLIVGSQFRMFGIVHTCCCASYHSHGAMAEGGGSQQQLTRWNLRGKWLTHLRLAVCIMKLCWWYLHQLGPQILHLKSPDVLGLILSFNLLSLHRKGRWGRAEVSPTPCHIWESGVAREVQFLTRLAIYKVELCW
jgi:hypothetical protein